MSWGRRLGTIICGALAGVFATAVMLLLMAIARIWLGIPSLPEAIPDRIAPTLSIHDFFSLFGKYGG